jgi:serine-type D-Ala-D-Ala endopeptidase (penicillin-binding protein 7)
MEPLLATLFENSASRAILARPRKSGARAAGDEMGWYRFIGCALLAHGLLAGAAPVSAATQSGARHPSVPEVRSQAYYVFDEADSSVLASRRELTPAPIASITKLMTALVVLEADQPLDEMVVITSADVRGTPGTGSRLTPAARLSRSDLLHLALMSSENRAAYALCRTYPKGLAACVRAMNAKATVLGMKSAHFIEPTGLSSSNIASPSDLAKLVLAASANPTIREYSTDADHTVRVGRGSLNFRNTNVLVKNAAWTVNLQKTGYIPQAGRCLVMQTVIDGRHVVIVLLNSFGTLTRIADAKRIRTWLETQHRLTAAAG